MCGQPFLRPDPVHARTATMYFWFSRVLFLVSLALPAFQFETWADVPTIRTLYGVECLGIGFLAPTNVAFVIGLFRSSMSHYSLSVGLCASVAGFYSALLILGMLCAFDFWPREGFFVWLVVSLIQAVGFAHMAQLRAEAADRPWLRRFRIA